MTRFDVVIVGAGHAGAQAAISLRQRRFAGSILLLGEEPVPPYERPPLSKEYLAGKKPFERLLLRPPEFWNDRGIELQLGAEVCSVDPQVRVVTTRDGEDIAYGALIWAAGGEPRRLACPGADIPGVHSIRKKADVDRLAAQLGRGARRVAIVGGGYIGLEAAAVLRELGLEVVVIEAQDRVLARVAGSDLSDFYAAEHRRQGVDVRLGETVKCFEEKDGAISGAVLASSEHVACDSVIVGIGLEPRVAPLLAVGAAGSDGVAVDCHCRTSLPQVYAIGDCAAHANSYAENAVIRLESVQNAHDMADIAAGNICGEQSSYEAAPWFWSNQYDLKLQTWGLCAGHDAAVVRGDPRERSFSIIYLKQGRVIAIDCVNRVKDYAQARRLVGMKQCVELAELADPDVPLKQLARAAA